MTFVNELISDEDKARIDWTQFRAWQFSPPHEPVRWTVDDDRNIFFIRLAARGREGGHPEVYAMYWRGDVVRLEAEIESIGDPIIGSDVYWKVFNLSIPEKIEVMRVEILKDLQEAIKVHGALHRLNPVNSVQIEFV